MRFEHKVVYLRVLYLKIKKVFFKKKLLMMMEPLEQQRGKIVVVISNEWDLLRLEVKARDC